MIVTLALLLLGSNPALASFPPEVTGPGTHVVAFLSSRCPCSASHEKILAELAKEYGPKGFTFTGIHSNADETEASDDAHFQAAQLPFAVLKDPGSKWADAMGALKTPHVFVIKDGRTLYSGGVDNSARADRATEFFLKDALKALAQGQEPPMARTRALGCVIRRE
ncbi:MAG TPA: redoxin family protein [Bdellovibrionota bacterium]|jgi:hypothetical protein|nr:redoxin family protein [Bdellovibrionota bacterium]